MNEQKNGYIALSLWAGGSEAGGSVGIIDKCSSIHNKHLIYIKTLFEMLTALSSKFTLRYPYLS